MAKVIQGSNSVVQSRSTMNENRGSTRIKLTAIAIAVSLTCQSSLAATLTVNDSGDFLVRDSENGTCTLREAFFSLDQGTTTVTIPDGTFTTGCSNTGGAFGTNDIIQFDQDRTITTLTGVAGFFVLKDLAINPAGPNARNIIWDASNLSRHFVGVNATISVDSMTLRNGNVPGAVGYGSSIFMAAGMLTITDSTITNNTAGATGAIVASTMDGTASLVLQNSDVTNNMSMLNGANGNFGGGVLISSNAEGLISNSEISGNNADQGGGLASVGRRVTINDSLIEDNTASMYGGGVAGSFGATIEINNSTINGNSATGNQNGEGGGGISMFTSALTINDSTISNNDSTLNAGGIQIRSSNFTVNRSLIANNIAATAGGIQMDAPNATILNSTVSGNISDNVGGIVVDTFLPNGPYGSLLLDNSTVANNSDTRGNSGVGGVFASRSTIELRNSIIADSFGPNCIYTNIAPAARFTSDSSSIIEGNACGSNARTVDPGLLALADNGGPTLTHGLAANSAALNSGNSGNCANTDQRGEMRSSGSLIVPIITTNKKIAVVDLGAPPCDVGAFEQ